MENEDEIIDKLQTLLEKREEEIKQERRGIQANDLDEVIAKEEGKDEVEDELFGESGQEVINQMAKDMEA